MKYYDNVFEGYLDQEEKFYDYGTSNVSGSDIFDTRTTGISFYNQFLDAKDSEYLREKKNLVGEIIHMSPNEYYDACSKHGWDHFVSPSSLKSQRAADKNVIEHLKQVITVYKKKFPMAFVNYADPAQEGLHRMYVAGELFGWDSPKHPVLVVRWADEERHKRETENKKKEEIERLLRKAVKYALQYRYSNMDDLRDQIQYELDSEFEYLDSIDKPVEFNMSVDNSTITISVSSFDYKFDKDDIRIEEIDIEEDDLDDIDLDLDYDEFIKKYLS